MTLDSSDLLETVGESRALSTHISTILAPTDLLELVERLSKESRGKKFAQILSNPPYTIYEGKPIQVYAKFYFIAKAVCTQRVSMIFPMGWQTAVGNGNGGSLKPIRYDPNLVHVDNFYELKDENYQVFPDAATSGVSIVMADSMQSTDTVQFSEYGSFVDTRDIREVRYWSDRTQDIFDKLSKWRNSNEIDSLQHRISPQAAHIPSTFFLKDSAKDPLVSFDERADWLKCWGSLSKGYGWAWVSPDHPLVKVDREGYEADRYKVVFGVAAGAYAIWRKARIFSAGAIFTSAFVAAYFDSLLEAQNFASYQKTMMYRFVVSETASTITTGGPTHRFVPDLAEILNPRTQFSGYSSDWTDQDLKKLLKGILTEDDWTYITQTALANDQMKRTVESV